jgi:hypothetical protein
MKFKIKPYIIIDNENYQTLITEIMNFSLDVLNGIIIDFENVFNGKYEASSFCGQHMAIVDFDNKIAKISYFDELIGEESTVDIYNMLRTYRDKLIEYENE